MTLQEILVSVRELSFDRYPIPVFLLKAKTGKFVTNDINGFNILPDNTGSSSPDYSYPYTPSITGDNLENLTQGLVNSGNPVAYTGYYSSTDSPDGLLRYVNASLNTNLTLFRRFFLSDAKLQNLVLDYYRIVLCTPTTLASLPSDVQLLNDYSARHLTLWVAIKLVLLRRVAEMAASTFSMSFTDGTGAVAGSNLNTPGDNISVNIGSVFSITDDNSVTSGYFNEDFNRVGSENVLGDKDSFWFKLYLWLRALLESEYGDFSFRQDNVIFGKLTLDRDINFRTYFDSYPFTLSANTRNIIS